MGRGPVHVVDIAGTRRAVRHYRRGGAVARVLGDRYLGGEPTRPWTELWASEAARARGIPTPRVVAGVVYGALGSYRADLMTDFVPHATELAALLFGTQTSTKERISALQVTGRLVARLDDTGVRHRDLNAHNVLISRDLEGPAAWLLDLDRCSVSPAGSRGRAPRGGIDQPAPMLARLERSLRKLEAKADETLSDLEWEALRAAASQSPPE